MTARTVVGIDPGPTPGLVALEIDNGGLQRRAMVQCSPDALLAVLRAFHTDDWVVAVERFVARGRMTRDQRVTAEQVVALQQVVPGLALRAAGHVKPWATDARLEAAGLLDPTKGMRHARDAARHALFAAVHADLLPDPLSRRAP